MIRRSAIKKGLVFKNMKLAHLPESRRFFKFTHSELGENAKGEEAEFWHAEHICSSDIARIKEEDLEHLEPVSHSILFEVDFHMLLAKRVKLEMAHGTVTGWVREIRTREIKIAGESIAFPHALLLDGDEISLIEVRNIEIIS